MRALFCGLLFAALTLHAAEGRGRGADGGGRREFQPRIFQRPPAEAREKPQLGPRPVRQQPAPAPVRVFPQTNVNEFQTNRPFYSRGNWWGGYGDWDWWTPDSYYPPQQQAVAPAQTVVIPPLPQQQPPSQPQLQPQPYQRPQPIIQVQVPRGEAPSFTNQPERAQELAKPKRHGMIAAGLILILLITVGYLLGRLSNK